MEDAVTLVATLGGQPQVVTFTLDLLLQRGESIKQVVVVYMASNPRYYEAFRRLSGEFAGDQYLGRPCHLRGVAIKSGSKVLADALTPGEVEVVRAAFFSLLADLKAQNQRIHLSLTGGRRIMALTALAAAMQHLTPVDSVWHLYTPDDLTAQARQGAILHGPPGADLRLIPVPFVPWAAYFPGLRPLLGRSAQELGEAGLGWLEEGERERCRQVWQALTPRQKEVLQLISEGCSRKQLAEKLGIGLSTVDTHEKAVYETCRQVWISMPVDRNFIQKRFAAFLVFLKQV